MPQTTMATKMGRLEQDVAGTGAAWRQGSTFLGWFPVLMHSTEQHRLRNGVGEHWKTLKALKPFPQRSQRTGCTCSLLCKKNQKPNLGVGKFSCAKEPPQSAGDALPSESTLHPGMVISFPLPFDLTLTSSFFSLLFFLLLLENRGKYMLISMLTV